MEMGIGPRYERGGEGGAGVGLVGGRQAPQK